MTYKYKIYPDLTDDNNILSHVFMECVPHEELRAIADGNEGLTPEEIEAREISIELKINGKKVDPSAFFNQFYEQYEQELRKVATKMIKEQTSEKLQEIQDKIHDMAQIAESMAEEINWHVEPNPFMKIPA